MTRLARFVPTVRATPLAAAVVVLLVATAVALRLRPDDVEAVVAWCSTNVQNLATHPIAAMPSSAFVVTEGLLPELLLVAAGFTWLERSIGTGRTAVVALSGHVLATLSTEYGAYLLTDAPTDRADVGISYALFAVLAACAWTTHGRTRRIALTLIAAAVLIPFAVTPDMTTTGHVLAALLGPATLTAISHTQRSRSHPQTQ